MRRVRVTAAVILLVLVMLLVLNAASVWADTFNPNPPVAGQAFTISGTSIGAATSWAVSSTCGSGTVYASGTDSSPGLFTDNIPALHAGTYYFSHNGDPTDCLSSGAFTVVMASPTTTVTCLASTLNVGSQTTCTATVSGSAFGPTTLTGDMVSWSDAGSVSFSSASCTLLGSSCSVTVTGTGAGSASVRGAFQGDSDNNPSSGTFPLTISAAPPIPEYPLGIPLLATLTIMAYAVIRRRTSHLTT